MKKIIIIVFVLLVLVAGYYLTSSSQAPTIKDVVSPLEQVVDGASEVVESVDEMVEEVVDSMEESTEDEAASTTPTTNEVREEELTEDVNEEVTRDLNYEDGTYSVNTSYALPNGGSHDMEVTLGIENDVVTSFQVVYDRDTSGGSTANQARFNEQAAELVVGTPVDEIALSRVGGASLTTGGFNSALEMIKADAKS